MEDKIFTLKAINFRKKQKSLHSIFQVLISAIQNLFDSIL